METRRMPGVLLSDDGRVFRLDVDYVIGREPNAVIGQAYALWLDGDVSGVSRHHVRVCVAGSGVQVMDLGSTNGTYLLFPDDADPRLVQPGESVEIPSGTQIMLAKRSFYYESLGDYGKPG